MPTHQTYSRIDDLICSRSFLPRCESADIGLKLVSDHEWVSCIANQRLDDNKGIRWILQCSLLHDELSKITIQSEIKQFFELNSDCGVPTNVVWDAFKAIIRGQWISVMSAYKKEKEKTIATFKDKIEKLEDRHL